MILSSLQKFGILALCAILYTGAVTGIAYRKGEAHTQAKWNAALAKQEVVAVKASEKARATEQQQSAAFAGAASTYLQATAHAPPSIAGTLPAALAAGTLKLRDDDAPRRIVSDATARSRAADAAATEALAQRAQAEARGIRIVAIGDVCDAREQQLDAQIVALQSVLRAERQKSPLR